MNDTVVPPSWENTVLGLLKNLEAGSEWGCICFNGPPTAGGGSVAIQFPVFHHQTHEGAELVSIDVPFAQHFGANVQMCERLAAGRQSENVSPSLLATVAFSPAEGWLQRVAVFTLDVVSILFHPQVVSLLDVESYTVDRKREWGPITGHVYTERSVRETLS